MDLKERFLTTREVADHLVVNVSVVLTWIKLGHLDAVNVGVGKKRPRYRISVEALERFIRVRTCPKPPPVQRRQPRRRRESTRTYF